MQHADLGGGGDVYFQYDAQGSRVRKVRINDAGAAANERIYLGGFELYRERDVVSGALSDINLERETLHIADDTGRVVMVETLTIDSGTPVGSPTSISRYQYGNQIGTVALEVDGSGNVINYEEYFPYGASSYRTVDSSIGVSAKRRRRHIRSLGPAHIIVARNFASGEDQPPLEDEAGDEDDANDA